MRPPDASVDPSHAETRRQLLEAAGAVFAEFGFRNATVREICRRAGANVAAINYHFGDKETLVCGGAPVCARQGAREISAAAGRGDDAPPEEKLRAFVHSFLLRIFDKGPDAWHGKLMSREMIEPTAALDSLIVERMRPMAAQIGQIIADILDCPLNDERVRLYSFSVVSQCVFYHHCRPVLCRMFPKQQSLNKAEIARLADHITGFSLAAMKNLSRPKS